MPSIQKLFLKRAREVWQREFPFLKPVDLAEIPQLPKGCRFLCDDYFAERGRAYFIFFDFSLRRIGEFSLGITVSDSVTRCIRDYSLDAPSSHALGMYSVGQFMGVQMRDWAIADVDGQVDALFRSLGQQPVGFAQTRSRHRWYPTSFELPQLEIFDAALADVSATLKEYVFPKLQIEYETHAA
ncbi:MAG: hypothetical protein JNL10_17585 [Verrucomicrobiales bacterium]|nr:hypothetical protein [Verrucomicrobiales bacterium]